MNIITTKNYEELSKKAAELVAQQLQQKPNSVLGLATGSTPLGLYSQLIKLHQSGQLFFKDVVTFNLDEYFGLSGSDEHSYHHYMFANLFNQLDIASANIFIPDGLIPLTEIKRYCFDYEQSIIDHRGIDLQFLGIGNNGHLGFNEPGSSFNSVTRLVDLSANTITANARFFSDQNLVPRQAITMGLATIMKARKIVLLASGIAKAEAVRQAVVGEVTELVPASILQQHRDVTLILDPDAASALK